LFYLSSSGTKEIGLLYFFREKPILAPLETKEKIETF
jgi:hypothetical protein